MFKAKKPERVIIFTGSKLKAKDLAISLTRAKFNCRAMHSDLSQQERDEVMYLFRSAQTDILVATDIVARGIDIDDITLVINFDVPHDAEDYVHRIGRTARAGAGGSAVTLVSEKDQPKFMEIERFLGKEVEKMDIPASLGKGPEYDGKFRGSKSSRGNRASKGTRGKKGKVGQGGHGKSHKRNGNGEQQSQSSDTQKKAGKARRRPAKKD